jgi:hypothetical protein
VLYRNVDIGDEIPATLYVAVAQILSYVFQLKVAQAGRPAAAAEAGRRRSDEVGKPDSGAMNCDLKSHSSDPQHSLAALSKL